MVGLSGSQKDPIDHSEPHRLATEPDRFATDHSHLVWFGLVWFGLVWFGLVWLGGRLPAVLIQVVHWVFLRAIETDHSDFVPEEKKDLSGSFSTFS